MLYDCLLVNVYAAKQSIMYGRDTVVGSALREGTSQYLTNNQPSLVNKFHTQLLRQ